MALLALFLGGCDSFIGRRPGELVGGISPKFLGEDVWIEDVEQVLVLGGGEELDLLLGDGVDAV